MNTLTITLALVCAILWVLLMRWSFICSKLVRTITQLMQQITLLVKTLDNYEDVKSKQQDIIEK